MREQDERGKVQLAEQRAESKGKMKGKIEMAKQLKALGVANEIIRQSSGLSEEEIKNL